MDDSTPKSILQHKKENFLLAYKNFEEILTNVISETKLNFECYTHELEELNEKLKWENESLKKEIEALELKIQSSSQKFETISKETEHYKQKKMSILEENITQINQIEALTLEKKELMKKLEKMESGGKDKKSAIHRLREENDDLSAHVNSLKLEIQDLKSEKDKIQIERNWFSDQHEKDFLKMEDINLQNKDLKQISENLKKELDESQQEIKGFYEQKEAFSAHIKTSIGFLKEISERDQTIRNLNQEIDFLQGRMLATSISRNFDTETPLTFSGNRSSIDESFNLNFGNFKTLPNKTGSLHQARSLTTNKVYSIKSMTNFMEFQELRKQGKIWEKLEKLSEKPEAIPNFHGKIEEAKSEVFSLHLFFDYFPISLRNLIEDMKSNLISFPLPFNKIMSYTKKLIAGFSFLQTLDICSLDLTTDNLLLDHSMENIYIIDFKECKTILNDNKNRNPTVRSNLYSSPEINSFLNSEEHGNLNPFKSSVFSLGLIIIELGILKIPERGNSRIEWNKNIEKCLNKFKKIYETPVMEENKKKILMDLIVLLKKCLNLIPEKRIDFVELNYIFQKKFIWEVIKN